MSFLRMKSPTKIYYHTVNMIFGLTASSPSSLLEFKRRPNAAKIYIFSPECKFPYKIVCIASTFRTKVKYVASKVKNLDKRKYYCS